MTTIVVVYIEYIASFVGADHKLMVSTGVLPFCIGVISALSIRGTYFVKGIFASLVFPCSTVILRFLVHSGPSRDEGPDTLLFIYTLGVTALTVVVVVFMYFILVISREKHL